MRLQATDDGDRQKTRPLLTGLRSCLGHLAGASAGLEKSPGLRLTEFKRGSEVLATARRIAFQLRLSPFHFILNPGAPVFRYELDAKKLEQI
jgi:hypothetical protein